MNDLAFVHDNFGLTVAILTLGGFGLGLVLRSLLLRRLSKASAPSEASALTRTFGLAMLMLVVALLLWLAAQRSTL